MCLFLFKYPYRKSKLILLEIFRNAEVGIIRIFVLLKYENELEIVASDKFLIQLAFDKSKFVFKFIWLGSISKLLPIDVTQKWQYYQL